MNARSLVRAPGQRAVETLFAAAGVHGRYAFPYPLALEANVLQNLATSGEGASVALDVGAHPRESDWLLERALPASCVDSFEPFAQGRRRAHG